MTMQLRVARVVAPDGLGSAHMYQFQQQQGQLW